MDLFSEERSRLRLRNFYAQIKDLTRIRDTGDGQVRNRWVETGPLKNYRHAQAFDHICAETARKYPPVACAGMLEPEQDSVRLLGDYDHDWADHWGRW